jgi:hypothetical protein
MLAKNSSADSSSVEDPTLTKKRPSCDMGFPKDLGRISHSSFPSQYTGLKLCANALANSCETGAVRMRLCHPAPPLIHVESEVCNLFFCAYNQLPYHDYGVHAKKFLDTSRSRFLVGHPDEDEPFAVLAVVCHRDSSLQNILE